MLRELITEEITTPNNFFTPNETGENDIYYYFSDAFVSLNVIIVGNNFQWNNMGFSLLENLITVQILFCLFPKNWG